MTLDALDFDGYLNLCDGGYTYTIGAYSPEIRKDMIWLHHDKDGMSKLFKQLPRHNSDSSPLSRHATIYSIDVADGDKEADVVSFLQVFRTNLDGGATQLYAVGKMYDKVKLNGNGATLFSRNIKLDTRELGIGHHVPF
jgi:methanesulfonate monooxygenase small subunit